MNCLPITNANSVTSSGSLGHGAGTPQKLADFWVRYLTPVGGTVLDPFAGAGTIGVSAVEYGCDYIGIERIEKYAEIAKKRIEAAQAVTTTPDSIKQFKQASTAIEEEEQMPLFESQTV